MKLEISKYGLNLGEEFEYVATFLKGKNSDVNDVEKYRIIMKGLTTGKESIFFLQKREGFFNNGDTYFIEILEEDDYKYITSDHIKNKNYNYYRLNKSKQTVLDIFDAWKSSNPMISVGGYTSQFMDKIKGYTWTYKFGNKTF